MYIPKHYAGSEDKAWNFVKSYPFATVISISDGESHVSHIPLIVSEKNTIFGHLARANPHYKLLEKAGKCLAIFHGPHAYMTPRWHTSRQDVPTWNYVAVHIKGEIRFFEDQKQNEDVLDLMAKRFEGERADAWDFYELRDPLKTRLLGGIISFEISPLSVEGKFKLGQNRSIEDRKGAIQGLSHEKSEMAQEISRLMKDLTP